MTPMTPILINNSLNCQNILNYTLKYTNTNTNTNTNISDIYIILILMMIIILIIITDHWIDYNALTNELDNLKKQTIAMNKLLNNVNEK
jgi:hypothetical protein